MKPFKFTKTFPTKNNIFESDLLLIEFINNNCKEIGCIENISNFIDNVKITKDTGIKVELNYILVDRVEKKHRQSGNKYVKDNSTRDIFELPFEVPDLLEGISKEEEYLVLSTVETFDCSPLEKCNACNGAGYCKNCDGKGYRNCNSCSGTGKRQVRQGNYANGNPKYVSGNCPSCDGNKTKPCPSCNGKGNCAKCNGKGKVTCKICDGSGFYQEFVGFINKYISISNTIYFSDHEILKPVLLLATGNKEFDDDLVEWKNNSKISFDKRNDAKKVNKLAPNIIDNLDSHINISVNQKIGRVHAIIETIPISFIDFSFEDKDYRISIFGKNNVVCYNDIPTKHKYKQNALFQIVNLFNKSKRKIAFAYIASFIFNSDNDVSTEEIKLFETILKNIDLKQDKKIELLNELSKKITFEEIKPKISCLKGDKRALVFAWHCVVQDNIINQSEIDAFNQLVLFFKIKEEEIELLKQKALKFSKLEHTQMIEEYFK